MKIPSNEPNTAQRAIPTKRKLAEYVHPESPVIERHYNYPPFSSVIS